MKVFWKAMKLIPKSWSDVADDERTATFLSLTSGFLEVASQSKSAKTSMKSATSTPPSFLAPSSA